MSTFGERALPFDNHNIQLSTDFVKRFYMLLKKIFVKNFNNFPNYNQ